MIQFYTYTHTFFFYISFHYGLSQDIKYSSLCYTVGPCFLLDCVLFEDNSVWFVSLPPSFTFHSFLLPASSLPLFLSHFIAVLLVCLSIYHLWPPWDDYTPGLMTLSSVICRRFFLLFIHLSVYLSLFLLFLYPSPICLLPGNHPSLFFFLLKDNSFTEFCFLLNLNMNQP